MRFTRFLEKYEYVRTLKLFRECFGDDAEFIAELYGELDGENECTGEIRKHTICILENAAGEILAMVHYKPMTAFYADGRREDVSYIMCVGTRADMRHRGLMDQLMEAVTSRLRAEGERWTFLVPVDPAIYRHLDFVQDWKFDPADADLLYADEELELCCAKLLRADNGAADCRPGSFEAPVRLLDR